MMRRVHWSAAKAAKVLSTVELQRKEELLEKQAGTVAARDMALAGDEQAKGAVLSAQANLETANINLGYTEIVSPIDGKISRTSITPGNVVGPESGSADFDRQPGPDVRDLPGEPARFAAGAGERPSKRDQGYQGESALCQRFDL